MEVKKPEVKKCLCPYCKEEINKAATVCKHCHTDFVSIRDKRRIIHFVWLSIIIPLGFACISLVLCAIAMIVGKLR